MSNIFRSVIFDIDGTLVDSVDLHATAWQEAFEHFGVDLPFQKIRNQIGKGGDQLLPTFLSQADIDKFGEDLKKWRGAHFKQYYLHQIKPFPESHALLQRLKKAGKKLATGSSAHEDELQVYLKLCEASQLFDVLTSADDAEKSKPHPDIFEVALQKLGSSAEETLVIGDSPYDAEAATKAGLVTIGFLSGGFPKKWLDDAGAIEIYEGPGDLLGRYDDSAIEKGFSKRD